jgi:hypothetical protein
MGFMSNPAAGGSFTTYVKYNAKAGRFYTKEDKPDADEFEVTNFTAIFDMDNLKTGWFLFAPGVAPVKNMDPSLSEAAPKPGEGFKRGFELNVFSDKNLMGMREFSSTAGAVIESMNDLYDDWQAGKEANAGKLPVVKCVGVTPVTNKHGTNYRPQFEIVSWADRPAEFGEIPQQAAAPAPAAKAAEHAPPPAAKKPEPAAASAGDDDVDF